MLTIVSPSVVPSDMMPLSEAGSPNSGTDIRLSRTDHVHPRLTSTSSGVLGANGEASITFTRTFANKPAVVMTYVEAADGQPVVIKVKSWTQDAQNNYTGCVIKGYRSSTIPTNLVTLLLGGVFNIFAGSVTGVEYSLTALAKS